MAKKMAFLTVIFVLILSVISGCNGENIGKDDGEAIEDFGLDEEDPDRDH